MILGEGHAAPLLDRLYAKRAVGIATGHDNADRLFALILGQRAEEHVDRFALAMDGIDLVQM